ncbi:hypothetical protein [Clostridium sp. SM-530-WT-3G]|uniref:hypothetical protein n=1 Tax=Clostridium sp. SM-530-WT-3G TaxID=2725303 RepID=UPI00145D2992|nr:hypothetical protein [Clostridium sp. SM-530-WT-3G]NME83737.1 hypothetical protein [Clostridium sp. SM-530-WT-3G]
MKKSSFGLLNDNKTILLIRPNSEDGVQGLMSLFIQTMRWIDYANKKSYIPYIDYKKYETQYYDGENNVWEYFFTQPTGLTRNEVYNSKNVIISGNTWSESVNYKLYCGEIFSDNNLCKECYDIIWKNIDLSEEVKKIIEKENEKLGVENCIGVYLRGTDYVRLKPTGEYVQPAVEEVISKIKEFLVKYGDINLFLVTEDESYYQKLTQEFKDKIKIVSFDSFISNYECNKYLSKSGLLETDKKKRGMDYLIKIILLSKCKYLVSSITMGSIAAYSINGGNYEDKYIFNLGYYE